MVEFLCRLLLISRSLFKSRARLEAEIIVLRQQLNVLGRRAPERIRLSNWDRFVLVWLYRFFPSILSAITGWHRDGFRSYWRWKSRRRAGRPMIDREIRQLIRQMSIENPPWGAPRIHGELLMLGIEVAQSTGKTFLQNRSTLSLLTSSPVTS